MSGEAVTGAPASGDEAAPVVLITGASSGIGRATAELFAANGWNVAATMRRPEGPGVGRLRNFALDVTDTGSIERGVAEVLTVFGRIDVLVNNAGFGLIGLFEEMTEAQVRQQMETNVFGVMNVTRAVLPTMRRQKRGRIIVVGSVAGRMSLPLYTLYSASKWAVEGFTESLGYEVAQHGIAVKIIEPGAIKTEFFGRSFAKPEGPRVRDYGRWADRVFETIKMKCANAPGPDIVAHAIWRAATDWPHGQLRYAPNGRLLMLGRSLVPASVHVRIARFLLGA